MTTTRQRSSAWHGALRSLVVLSLLQVLPAGAITLGQETILSFLGDPVEVEIDVLQWGDVDLERVQVSLASDAEYQAFALDRNPALEQLRFNLIGPDVNGQVRVLVSTRDPLNEPWLELLLELRWPGGSLRREYVLLFDLPVAPAPSRVTIAPAVAAQNPSGQVTSVQPEPASATEMVTIAQLRSTEPETDTPQPRSQGVIVVESAQAPVAPPPTGRRVYQVREGDGLWSIAQQFHPAGAGDNIYQTLLSLHDLNRAAFINGNISLLKANVLLQIPAMDDIAAIPAATAEAVFEQRWAEGTARLQTALRGDPLPAFSEVYTGERVEAGPEGGQEERPAGVETGRVLPDNSLLMPANMPVVVAVDDDEAAAAGVLLGELVSGPIAENTQQASGAAVLPPAVAVVPAAEPAQAAAGTVNPWLDRVDGSARDLRDLLQNRALQIARLEQQLVDVNQRMRDAQQLTSRLNQALEQALASRDATNRGTAALGVLALVLLAGLVVAMVMVARLTLQLQRQGRRIADIALAEAGSATPRTGADRLQGGLAAATAVPAVSPTLKQDHPEEHEDLELQDELLEFIGPAGDEDDPPRRG